jgi:hypothetical protein
MEAEDCHTEGTIMGSIIDIYDGIMLVPTAILWCCLRHLDSGASLEGETLPGMSG